MPQVATNLLGIAMVSLEFRLAVLHSHAPAIHLDNGSQPTHTAVSAASLATLPLCIPQVTTNLLGIVTVPFEFRLVLSSMPGANVVSVDPQNLVVKLLLTVLVPSVLGKLARDLSKPVCSFVTKYKVQLSLFSTLNLAAIVWQTLSGARDTLLQQAFTSVLLVVVLSSGLHVVLLALNAVVVSKYVLRLPFREGVAVMIMSSQKSAPVAVTVISYLTPNLTQQGLMAM
jgi:sodium/bile acid cotransporter 7